MRCSAASVRPRIDAIITNHNTSLLAEIALLSLKLMTRSSEIADLSITVTDNWSTDPAVDRLKRTAALVGAQFVTTRWPHAGAAASVSPDSAGDAMRDFVLSHDDCDYYWFIDSDIEFTDPGTLGALLDVYRTADDLWAVTANLLRSDDVSLYAMRNRHVADGEVIELALERSKGGRNGRSRKVFYGQSQTRCPHACTLVARTKAFTTSVREIGLSPAAIMSGDTDLAGWYDTFALTTRAMQVAGYRHQMATTTVNHAFGGSWAAEHTSERAKAAGAKRRRLCEELGVDV